MQKTKIYAIMNGNTCHIMPPQVKTLEAARAWAASKGLTGKPYIYNS